MESKPAEEPELSLRFTTLQEDVVAIIGSYFLECKDFPKYSSPCAGKILAKVRQRYAQKIRELFMDIEAKFIHKIGVSDGDMFEGTRVGFESWLEIPLEKYNRETKQQEAELGWQSLKDKYGGVCNV